MPSPTMEPGTAQAYVELRRARILATLDRCPEPPPAGTEQTPLQRLTFFRREAEELYWNELAWEQLTDEEVVGGGHLTELVFPGLLALVNGLLLDPDSQNAGASTPRTYPDVVEEILTFLGERCAVFSAELGAGADSQKILWARAMTLRLIDLVLHRLYRLTEGERNTVESGE